MTLHLVGLLDSLRKSHHGIHDPWDETRTDGRTDNYPSRDFKKQALRLHKPL